MVRIGVRPASDEDAIDFTGWGIEWDAQNGYRLVGVGQILPVALACQWDIVDADELLAGTVELPPPVDADGARLLAGRVTSPSWACYRWCYALHSSAGTAAEDSRYGGEIVKPVAKEVERCTVDTDYDGRDSITSPNYRCAECRIRLLLFPPIDIASDTLVKIVESW
jgi:hypothetical protein